MNQIIFIILIINEQTLPVKEGIIKYIEEALEDVPMVNLIYLVGRFGGSIYYISVKNISLKC